MIKNYPLNDRVFLAQLDKQLKKVIVEYTTMMMALM